MLSEKIRTLPESATLRASERAKELAAKGVKVLRFDIGEPGFDTPAHIVEAAYEAMRKGLTHYGSSRGLRELREAICQKFEEEYGADLDPDDNVIITPGTKYAIYAILEAILNPGDEVLLLSPCWVSYEGITLLAGGKARFISSNRSFRPDVEALKEGMSKRVKAIIINSPNNPTGVIFDEREVKAIAEVAHDEGALLISDEIYEKIIFEGKHVCALRFMSPEEGCVVVNGFSKAFAMTGWRLGYVVGPKELIAGINKIMQQTVSCVPPFIQWAGYVALTSPKSEEAINEMVMELKRRRDILYEGLRSLKGLRLIKPKGAFYFFPEVEKPDISSVDLANYLLERYAIMVIPGKPFGGYDKHIRISYGAVGDVEIKEFLERLRKALEEIEGKSAS